MPRVAVLCIICIILYYVLSGIMYFDTLRQPPRMALGLLPTTYVQYSKMLRTKLTLAGLGRAFG